MGIINIGIRIKDAFGIRGSTEKIQNVVETEFSGYNTEKSRAFINMISEYPPLTRGNFAPPPYWRRGVGRVVNSSGMIDRPSEHLTESWRIDEQVAPWANKTVIGNPASYAALVVGDEDHMDAQGNMQTEYHQVNGWKTINEVLAAVGLRTGQNPSAAKELLGRVVDKITRIFKS
jgi:hypothetical protein